jgi:metal-responsive CopG/Arc/MetJ family transcriptional regulator
MRTTVELKPEHRSRLLAIAAKRGQKGFSSVLSDAVESYLGEEAERQRRREKALQLCGTLKRKEAADWQKRVAALRASWR